MKPCEPRTPDTKWAILHTTVDTGHSKRAGGLVNNLKFQALMKKYDVVRADRSMIIVEPQSSTVCASRI